MHLFGRLVDRAVELFGPLADFDPYLVEWHRAARESRRALLETRADYPSGWQTGSRACRGSRREQRHGGILRCEALCWPEGLRRFEENEPAAARLGAVWLV